jgi:hypothetical protein
LAGKLTNLAGKLTNLAGKLTNLAGKLTNLAGKQTNLARKPTDLARNRKFGGKKRILPRIHVGRTTIWRENLKIWREKQTFGTMSECRTTECRIRHFRRNAERQNAERRNAELPECQILQYRTPSMPNAELNAEFINGMPNLSFERQFYQCNANFINEMPNFLFKIRITLSRRIRMYFMHKNLEPA